MCKRRYILPSSRNRGAAAVIAMMFMVIFASLAAAMAIVSEGNLRTADSQLKISRSLSVSETGMRFMIHRLNEVANEVTTRDGVIDPVVAQTLWQVQDGVLDRLVLSISNDFPNASMHMDGKTLHIGPIEVASGAPAFNVEITPHPLPGEDYDSAFYDRPPYNEMTPAVSNASPLDARWIRVRVVSFDGPPGSRVHRSVSMDFMMQKTMRYAILSRSRVMLGRNVMIEGPIGSRFNEVNLPMGHPVQMESDFRGLSSELDEQLDIFREWLIANDMDGNNRLNIHNPSEVDGIDEPWQYDYNGDGYIDELDFFMAHFDANGDGRVTLGELLDKADNQINAQQLFTMIDTFGSPLRPGYNDGFIDNNDRYAKVKGQIHITADLLDWEAGAANGAYQQWFDGMILPPHGMPPVVFQAPENEVYQFNQSDFQDSVNQFRSMADGGDVMAQMASQVGGEGEGAPNYDPEGTFESVPFGAAHPYDYYQRPVFENMTFTNVVIPKGTNALFRNCRFIGVTFIQTNPDNVDPDYNFAGMQEADGSQKHPDRTVVVNGQVVTDSKQLSNNLRFDNCTFEGSIVTDVTNEYTHTRNKIAFTGETRFDIEDSQHLTEEDKALFKRSTILAPHYSIEMGTFVAPYDSAETVKLSGMIVAGILDMRGQVDVHGSIISTFEPQSNTGPVIGETSPQFNTTLGYFSSEDGDLEAEMPVNGIGIIRVRHDPNLAMPDGILGPISIVPVMATYTEGGK